MKPACHIWCKHKTSFVAGEMIDPLTFWDYIDDGMAKYMKKAVLDESNLDKCNQEVDKYLDDVLKVPAIKQYDDFNDAY